MFMFWWGHCQDLNWMKLYAHGVRLPPTRLQREHARQGEIWQIEPYDRIMRDADEATEKAKYIRDNPFTDTNISI